jgi:hypothetical protein
MTRDIHLLAVHLVEQAAITYEGLELSVVDIRTEIPALLLSLGEAFHSDFGLSGGARISWAQMNMDLN